MEKPSDRNTVAASGVDRPLTPPLQVAPAPAVLPTVPPPETQPETQRPPAMTHQAVLDANGFDPADFEWRPVPRRARTDGWTSEKQQRFIEALARTGVVERACQEVGLSVRSAYNLRNSPGGERFARAWKTVLARAADRLLDVVFEQAIEGEEIPIFDQDGVRTGSKRRFNTRLVMQLLRAYHPERFRHAHHETRHANEPLPPPAEPLPAITATLVPEPPAEPALLATPERLDAMIYTAQRLAIADEHAPPDDKEPYRLPKREAQHPKVFFRARIRKTRRMRLQDEAMIREGFTEDDFIDPGDEDENDEMAHHRATGVEAFLAAEEEEQMRARADEEDGDEEDWDEEDWDDEDWDDEDWDDDWDEAEDGEDLEDEADEERADGAPDAAQSGRDASGDAKT